MEEQRRLGADADKCTIYEMFHYHQMLDDNELVETYRKCKGGELLCGECKTRSKELLREQHTELQERVAQVTDQQVKEVLAED